MRICSDFHDYYDCIQSLGYDPTIVYLRKKHKLEKSPFNLNNYWYEKSSSYLQYFLIGFCGKIYSMIKIKNTICYNINEVNEVMLTILRKRDIEKYFSRHRYSVTESHFKTFFDKKRNEHLSLFRDFHSPIFVATKRTLVFNDSLKEVAFYRIFDAYQAFQEISMYFGGVLGSHTYGKTKYKGKPMNNKVSDKDLKVAKGFDEYSFKKTRRNK